MRARDCVQFLDALWQPRNGSGVAKKFGEIGPSFPIGIDLWVGRQREQLLVFKGQQKTILNEKAIYDVYEEKMQIELKLLWRQGMDRSRYLASTISAAGSHLPKQLMSAANSAMQAVYVVVPVFGH